MAGVELATGYVALVPSARGIASQITAQIAGPAGAAGTAGGQAAGKGLAGGIAAGSVGIGAKLKRAAILPLLGVGVAAYASARDVDAAYNTIRAGTGKTGKTLDGLEASFRRVARRTPADFGLIATAISDVHSRLKLTGKPLEDVALQMVRLTRISGGDIKTNVAGLTRLFGDWSIPVDKQSVALDKVFRTSQKTGIGISDLAQNAVQFGSPLRQLGFSFEQTLAMFGRFEREGVNTQTVMAGMRFGLKTFAQAGRDPQEALRETIAQIKGASTAAEANGIAFKVFGVRAGPDMAAAIREGRFELDELVGQINNGKDTIAGAAKDTGTLSGKFGILRNTASLALAPLAMPVLESFTSLAGGAIPIVQHLADAFTALPGPVRTGLTGFIAFAALRGPLGKLATGGKAAVMSLAHAAGAAGSRVKAFFAAGGGKDTIGIRLLQLRDRLSAARSGLVSGAKAAATFGKNAVVSAAGIARQTAAFVAQKAAQVAAAAAAKAMAAAQWVLNAAMSANPITLIVLAIAALVGGLILAYQKVGWFRDLVDGAFSLIKTVISGVFNWVKSNWPLLLTILTGPLGLAVTFIVRHWDTIKNAVMTAIGFVRDVITTVVSWIVAWWDFNWQAISLVVTTVWGAIRSGVSAGVDLVRGVIEGFVTTARSVWDGFWNGLVGVIHTVTGPISSAVDGVIGVVRRVWNAIADVWNSIHIEIPKVHIPGTNIDIGGGAFDPPNLRKLAQGALIRHRPGGTAAILGEGRHDEAVLNLPQLRDLANEILAAGTPTGSGAGPLVKDVTFYTWDSREAARVLLEEAAFARLAGV